MIVRANSALLNRPSCCKVRRRVISSSSNGSCCEDCTIKTSLISILFDNIPEMQSKINKITMRTFHSSKTHNEKEPVAEETKLVNLLYQDGTLLLSEIRLDSLYTSSIEMCYNIFTGGNYTRSDKENGIRDRALRPLDDNAHSSGGRVSKQ